MSSQKQLQQTMFRCVLSIAMVAAFCSFAPGQTPFATDDTDVTPKGHFHLELNNEFDILQKADFPSLKQNAAVVEIDYGLWDNLEIGIAPPLITIFNASGTDPKTVAGLGDVNFSAKYNFLKEREHSRMPAMSIALNLELPTGNTERQLGSGLLDVYMNGVLQKSLSRKTTLRLNGGILFAGNETTGVVGIRTRGTVFTAGASLVKQVTPHLDLGVELAGALTKTFELGKGELETTFGGNYALRDNLTIDFAILGGKFAASPRLGAKLGFSIDF